MKKLILSAFVLGLALAPVCISANNQLSVVKAAAIGNDDRKVIKAEELPEAVAKNLAGDAYKGWTVKEAAMVSHPAATADAATTQAHDDYYEVILTNGKETKTVKFQKDGKLLD